MAFIIRATCIEEYDTAWEGWEPCELFVHEREGGQSLTSRKFATQYEAAGYASAVAAGYDGALIAKYGRRVWEFEVVPA